MLKIREALTSTMVYGMVRSVLVKYYNVLYIGVSEVQPMVTRTLLSNYPVTLGDRQSPPLISSGLQSFEKDTGKPVKIFVNEKLYRAVAPLTSYTRSIICRFKM